jgi:hypothetical protein
MYKKAVKHFRHHDTTVMDMQLWLSQCAGYKHDESRKIIACWIDRMKYIVVVEELVTFRYYPD